MPQRCTHTEIGVAKSPLEITMTIIFMQLELSSWPIFTSHLPFYIAGEQDSLGGFLKLGIPKSWMVYTKKSYSHGWFWDSPRRPPYIGSSLGSLDLWIIQQSRTHHRSYLLATLWSTWQRRIPLWYPLVICYITIENGHRNSGFCHE